MLTMDILRYGHDSFGERVINGVSWDLLPRRILGGRRRDRDPPDLSRD